VPLSDRALKIIDSAAQSSLSLFAKEGGEPLSNMAMLELLQGMGFGEDLTVHGFRSTFEDWCSEQTAHPNEMSELALAHTVSDKVEAAYRRGDMRESVAGLWPTGPRSVKARRWRGNVVTLRA
jgi:integrase